MQEFICRSPHAGACMQELICRGFLCRGDPLSRLSCHTRASFIHFPRQSRMRKMVPRKHSSIAIAAQ